MGKTVVHDELKVTTPPTFVEMTREELNQAFVDNNPNRWGARDVRHHLMFVIMWQDSNALLAKLISTDALAKRVEKLTSKGYRDYDYQLGSFSTCTLCGIEAEGFDFSYELRGVRQMGQNIVFKHGKTCYTLYWIERKGAGKSAERARQLILDSLALV